MTNKIENKTEKIAIIIVLLLLSIYTYSRIIEISKDIEICKENGYDGVKFINQFTTEVECSNKTESEKLGVK